jgi:hypothetical protein
VPLPSLFLATIWTSPTHILVSPKRPCSHSAPLVRWPVSFILHRAIQLFIGLEKFPLPRNQLLP